MEDMIPEEEQIQYTQQQIQFIYAPKNRDIKVTACAGSGKTQCVLMYVKEAIQEGFNPSSICLTTFNIQASNDMKKRAVELIGQENANQIEITNIDKLITKLFNNIQKAKKENTNRALKNQEQNQLIDVTLVEKQNQVYQDLQDLSLSDDAQNIYEFRGSNYEFLRSKVIEDVNRENKIIYLSNDYNMLDLKLTTNFRCSSKITSFANDIIKSFTIIQQDQMQSYEDLESYKNTKSIIKPTLISYSSYEDQFDNILCSIKSFLNQGYKYGDIAIVSPTGSILRDIECKLEKNNTDRECQIPIPYWSFIGKNNDYNFKYRYKEKRATLLTIHKSKGLQWKILFFVGLNDDTFPKTFLKQKNNENRQTEEMRRLFYVGATRAAYILNMSYFYYPNRAACRFLSKINEDLIEFKGYVTIIDGKGCEQETSDQLKNQDSNYQRANNFGKQISEIFDEMSNAKYLEELEFTQKKYLQAKHFELKEEIKVHEKMFQKQQIQNIFFHQSVDLLFTYLETNIFAELTKSPIFEYLNLFVEYVKKQEINEILILDKIQPSELINTQLSQIFSSIFSKNYDIDIHRPSDFDPKNIFNIFEYFTISGQNTLYEICKSFKKTKKIEKQVMMTVLAKVSILKKKYDKDINKIKFYNPIQGTVLTVLIKDWEFHQEFLDFIGYFNQKLQNIQKTD
ncbi:hypothetical protein ABPG74_017575 [Tetrahymena malaccensis]